MTNYEWFAGLSDNEAKDFIMNAGFAALMGDTTVAHLKRKSGGKYEYEILFNDDWKEAEHEE